MPDMPGLIARPRFMRLHDEYLNASRDNRRRFGLLLLAGDPLADVYKQLGIGKSGDWRHLEREFYAEEGLLAYWPSNRYGYLGNKQEILRQGLLETIRVAEDLPEDRITRQHFKNPWPDQDVKRHLETWWLCSGNRFEVNVLDGEGRLIMMILTPAMPELPDSRKPKLENDGVIWTVAHKDVLTRYLNEYRQDQSRYPSIRDPYKVAGTAGRDARDLRRINKLDE